MDNFPPLTPAGPERPIAPAWQGRVLPEPWEEPDPEMKTKKEWHRTRFTNETMNKRQQKIFREGLPAVIQFQDVDQGDGSFFHQIRVEPDPDEPFEPLLNEVGLNERDRWYNQPPYNQGLYHISIGKDWQLRSPEARAALDEMREKYREPKKHRFKVHKFGGGGTAQVGYWDDVYQDVKRLHDLAGYRIPLHISL